MIFNDMGKIERLEKGSNFFILFIVFTQNIIHCSLKHQYLKVFETILICTKLTLIMYIVHQ